MRRILATTIVLAAIGGFALLAAGATEQEAGKTEYWIQLDNAFGLTEGSDFKISGVRAGAIGPMKVDRRAGNKALVSVVADVPGAPKLKTDVTCETRPQSLIGEYFIDCNPGRNPTELKSGSTVPVERTFSTIPADLVNNILRLPHRQRLRIILNEFGAGVAARGTDLNAVIRRAVPALRETNKLLDVLADENQTLTQLTTNADVVVGELAKNRSGVVSFVRESRDTAAASADRRIALAATFRLLPDFLRTLRPNMVALGRVADSQTPMLRDLDAASGNLKAFLDTLGPFSQASRPSISSLGETSNVGRQAIPPLTKTVAQLENFAQDTPELAQNLRIVLDDLRDSDRAVEKDPRSPGGKGWNGFEALLMYVFWQSQGINIFDRNGYILKVALFENPPCSEYHDAEGAEHAPQRCVSALGPNQPGLNEPDPSYDVGDDKSASKEKAEAAAAARALREAAVVQGAAQAAGAAPAPGAAPQQTTPKLGAGKPAVNIPASLRGLLGGGRAAAAPAAAPGTSDEVGAEFLNYLFAP
jgi:ABC-type transporter Mla subunit MlaD